MREEMFEAAMCGIKARRIFKVIGRHGKLLLKYSFIEKDTDWVINELRKKMPSTRFYRILENHIEVFTNRV